VIAVLVYVAAITYAGGSGRDGALKNLRQDQHLPIEANRRSTVRMRFIEDRLRLVRIIFSLLCGGQKRQNPAA